MKIVTAATNTSRTREATSELGAKLANELSGDPGFLLVAYTEHHDPEQIREELKENFPGTVILGSSTCRGLITEAGLFGFTQPALGCWAFADPESDFGTARVRPSDKVSEAVAVSIHNAQAMAGRPGEVPDLVWVHAGPGTEEALMEEIRAVLGSDVLICGGSSADESIGGRWSQFDTNGAKGASAIALIYCDGQITHHFQNGYLPTEHAGRITRATGRTLYEIDGKPAAEVYNQWTSGLIDAAIADRNVNILGLSAWSPLGKSIGKIGLSPELMVDTYCLVHPDSVGPDGELNLFADVEEGSPIVLMKSGKEELVNRATQVVRTAMKMAPDDSESRGGLSVFCAGCMLALGEDIHDAAAEIQKAHEGVPFMGIFTFGEQGSFSNGERLHGNLMISSTLFGAQGPEC